MRYHPEAAAASQWRSGFSPSYQMYCLTVLQVLPVYHYDTVHDSWWMHPDNV